MSTSTSITQDELNGYINELTTTKQQLVDYRSHQGDANTLADQSSVLLLAIDNLLARLAPPDLGEKIDLNSLVRLADDVRDVLSSASLFLSRRGASAA